MVKNDWWVDFFENECADCVLTLDADPIADFLTEQCGLDESVQVLDQCCGKGFLSSALSRTGAQVTGVDFSKTYIDFARQHYQTENCRFFQGDARTFVADPQADVAINWHTSFGYSEVDAENIPMLAALSQSLKSGGQFVISTMNPDYILANFQRFIVRYVDYQDSTIIAIRESYLENDMLKSDWLFVFPDGKRIQRQGQTKLYRLGDFERMLSQCGLRLEKAYGSLQGEAFHQYSPNLILLGKKAT